MVARCRLKIPSLVQVSWPQTIIPSQGICNLHWKDFLAYPFFENYMKLNSCNILSKLRSNVKICSHEIVTLAHAGKVDFECQKIPNYDTSHLTPPWVIHFLAYPKGISMNLTRARKCLTWGVQDDSYAQCQYDNSDVIFCCHFYVSFDVNIQERSRTELFDIFKSKCNCRRKSMQKKNP